MKVVLSRDRDGTLSMVVMERRVSKRLNGNASWVVQTNMDIKKSEANNSKDEWPDICYSRYRRSFVKKSLGTLKGPVTLNDLWCLLSCDPGLAYDMIF